MKKSSSMTEFVPIRLRTIHEFFADITSFTPKLVHNCEQCFSENIPAVAVPTYSFYKKPHIKVEPGKAPVQVGFVKNTK